MSEKKIAIITARGGSKRIPRKNIRDFLGKPIMAYSIDVALRSELFDEVMVSTDSQEIADIARKYGAKVPFMRSREASDDFASTLDVLKEVIGEYRKCGDNFQIMCCIYPCAPLLRVETLKSAYQKLNDYDAVVPVCLFPAPIERALKIEFGYLSFNNVISEGFRSQDVSPKYFDCGQFYFSRIDRMYESNSLIPERTFGYIMEEMEVQDINTFEDWELAESKYKILKEKSHI